MPAAAPRRTLSPLTWMLPLLLLSLLVPAALAAAPRISLDASFDQTLTRLEGTLTLHDFSSSPSPFLSYPAHLNALADVDELTFSRIFPGPFTPLELHLTPQTPGSSVTPLPLEQAQALMPGTPPSALFQLHSAPPASGPQETASAPEALQTHLSVQFSPRFGPFGKNPGAPTLLATGGWLPIFLEHAGKPDGGKAAANLQLSLTLSWPAYARVFIQGVALVPQQAGSCHSTSTTSCAHWEGPLGSFGGPVLAVGTYQDWTLEPLGPTRLLDWTDASRARTRLTSLVMEARRGWTLAEAPPPVTLIRAPLRRALALSLPGCVLISDRALKVMPGMQRLHADIVLEAVFQAWRMAQMPAAFPAELVRPLALGLARKDLEQTRTRRPWGHFGLSPLLEPLGFLPAVDALLHAPRFAFAEALLEQPYRSDPLREFLPDLLEPQPDGQTFLKRWEEMHPGVILALDALIHLPPQQWLETLCSRLGLAAPALFDEMARAMRLPRPADHRITRVTQEEHRDGWQVTLELETSPLDEPPPLPARHASDAALENARLRIEGRSRAPLYDQRVSPETRILTLNLPERARHIQLDPEGVRLERSAKGTLLTDNNRWPPPMRLLASAQVSSLDVGTLRPSGTAAVYLTAPHQRDWLWMADISSAGQLVVGGSVGGMRYFGPYRDEQWRVHRAGVSVTAAHRAGLAVFDEATELFLDTVGLRASYRYESRLLLSESGRGAGLAVALEAGRARTSEYVGPYLLLGAGGVKPMALHPHHILVTRLSVDGSVGLPEGGQGPGSGMFSLGGSSQVRAIAPGSRIGNQRWVGSLELRSLLFRELDVNLGFARVRRLQGVLLADAGAVGAGSSALLAPSVGVGAGMRVHLDMFGLYTGLAGVELAWAVPLAWETPQEAWYVPRTLLRFVQPF